MALTTFTMGKSYEQLNERHQAFIEAQQMFFVATAGHEGKVNLSPKGLDSLRVMGPNRITWLNVTGSGNETAAHVKENGRMTLMFCAFEGAPMILRVYGQAREIQPGHESWGEYAAHFPDLPGARQIFELQIDMVQTSCGMAVPLYDFQDQRQELVRWAEKKGPNGIRDYWQEKNLTSLDGYPTGLGE